MDWKDACEEIDAGIFSGDFLYCCDLKKFKEYLARGNRAVKEHEEFLKEQTSEENT